MAIDAAAVYASAIRTPGLLPNAQIVVDHFHLVKLGNDALTKVRRRVTWELRDHRAPKARSTRGESSTLLIEIWCGYLYFGLKLAVASA